MRTAFFSLLTATSCCNRRSQMAAAVALGIACGLVPKASGTFVLLIACAFVFPVHLVLTITVAAIVAVVAIPLTGIIEQLGEYSLNHQRLSEFWLALDTYPLIPWLGLHNTLVHGAVLLGLAQSLPVYTIASVLLGSSQSVPAQARRRRVHRAVDHELAAQTIDPFQLIDASQATDAVQPIDSFQHIDAIHADASLESELLASNSALDDSQPVQTQTEQSQTIQRIEAILSEVDGDEFPNGASSDDVLRRAAQLVNAVDDILTAIDVEQSSGKELSISQLDDSSSQPSEMNDLITENSSASFSNLPLMPPVQELRPESVQREPMQRDTPSNTRPRSIPGGQLPFQQDESGAAGVSVRARFEQRRISREGDVLRNLLHHLRDLKEKV